MTKKTRLVLFSALISLLISASFTVSAKEWAGPDQVLAAAKAGDAEAQLEMGILYEYGFFMSDNKAPALAWYSLAADQGNVKAAQLRDKLQATMSSDEIRQAEDMKPSLAVAMPSAPAQESMPAPEAPAPSAPEAPAPQPESSSAPEVTTEPAPQNSAPANDGIPTIQ